MLPDWSSAREDCSGRAQVFTQASRGRGGNAVQCPALAVGLSAGLVPLDNWKVQP